MRTEGIILAVTTKEAAECTGLGLELGYLAYRTGADGILLRSLSLGDCSGGVMVLMGTPADSIDPAPLARAIRTECEARRFHSVLLDTQQHAAWIAPLAEHLHASGLTVYLPEHLAVPGSIPLISSEVTGGSFALYLEEQTARYSHDAALELVPLALDFTLPSAGKGEALSSDALAALLDEGHMCYYSRELMANYFTFQDPGGLTHFVLFDNADTLREKIRCARAQGITRLILPYGRVREMLPDILEI